MMKTIFYSFLLFTTGMTISAAITAQPGKNTAIAFKEIHQKQPVDNFTAREIKKKELQIAPSTLVLLNIADTQAGEIKYRKKKRTRP